MDRVVNTSKSIRRDDTPPEERPFDPGVDDEEAEDEPDREGNEDPDDGLSSALISIFLITQLNPAVEMFDITLQGIKADGTPFWYCGVHRGKMTAREVMGILRRNATVRYG